MIAIDTNILVYSHRKDSTFYKAAFSKLKQLAESGFDWAIPWPCIHEFISVVTHPKIYKTPSSNDQVIQQIEIWMESPTLRLLGEGDHYWNKLRTFVCLEKVKGSIIHDARIAAICLESGVTSLWTADRDFSMFPGVRIQNPLNGASSISP